MPEYRNGMAEIAGVDIAGADNDRVKSLN